MSAARSGSGGALPILVATILVFAFGLSVASLATRLLGGRIDLGNVDPGRLQDSTVQLLRNLEEPIDLTAFLSAEASVPPAQRGVERGVRSLLAAMFAVAPDRVSYRVLDPGLDPEYGPAYASRRGASPIVVDRVLGDAEAQTVIWSSLVLARGKHRETLVQNLQPSDLPHLEELLVTHLTANIRPVVAVDAPRDQQQALLALIAESGAQAVAVDFDRDPLLPETVDAFLWMAPKQAGPAHGIQLRRLLDRGVSVIVGGQPFDVTAGSETRGQVTVRADLRGLLRPFGLRIAEALVLDHRPEPAGAGPMVARAGNLPALLLTRIPPSQTDTSSLRIPPTGVLVLDRVSPLEIDHMRARAAGFRAMVVSTTSEHSQLVAPGEHGELGREQLAAAVAVPKQPWLVNLVPHDPWRGTLLVAASASFGDQIAGAPGGHTNVMFLRGILRSLLDEDRLARRRVPRQTIEVVPELGLAARLTSRTIVVLLVPAIWLLAWRSRRGRTLTTKGNLGRRWPITIAVVGGIACYVLAGLLGNVRGPAMDLSADQGNRPAAMTRTLLEQTAGELTVEYWLSEPTRLPAGMKATSTRVISALRGLGLRPHLVRPESLDADGRRQLQQDGIEPFEVDRIEDDALVTVSVHSGLRLRLRDRTTVIPRLDQHTAPQLEFLLASALRRLQTGQRPRVGVLSDLPRLSPAEAYMDYQQKGHAAPIGSDVYSEAKQLLVGSGYEVVYLPPEAVVVPPDLDLLVWLQPRFMPRTLPQVSAYLAQGGKLLIAVQHYNVQQRQYRGAGFETVYWPQPQFHGLNDWLESFGVRQIGGKRGELAGEILYDRNHARLQLPTAIHRSAIREHEAQAVARPFLIRAHGQGLSKESGITRGLGELLFVWGNRFVLDHEALAKAGITADTLVTTSRHWWTFEWSGRWLPHESFEEPPGLDKEPQPLALLLEGRFPRATAVPGEDGRPMLHHEVPADGAAGRLLLVGCSEMFKDAHLHDPRYQHDQFLRNAVAELVHDPELAAIQARLRTPERLPVHTATTRFTARGIAILLAPLVLMAFGLAFMRLRRRPVMTRWS